MVHQQHARTVRTDQPRRTGKVSTGVAALEYIRVRMQECIELRDDRRLPLPLVTVALERVDHEDGWLLHGHPQEWVKARRGSFLRDLNETCTTSDAGLCWPAIALPVHTSTATERTTGDKIGRAHV